jgi:glucosylceramidase
LFYLTKPDKSALFEKQETGISIATDNSLTTIEVNTDKTFQEMDGFGFTLTGGSAFHINNMSAAKRHELLTELFSFR